MRTDTLYIKLEKNIKVETQDVFLKDMGTLFCANDNIVNKCKAVKICTFKKNEKRKIISVMKVIELICENCRDVWIENIGETDTVIELVKEQKAKRVTDIIKIIFVSLISFFGTGFTIMAFHNDIQIGELFNRIHEMVTGMPSNGYSALEISYSIGLSIGIIVFFNHIGGRQITSDPTPIAVEMRIYEDEVNQTLIDYADRMGIETDIEK